MPTASPDFDFGRPPFDLLTEGQRAALAGALDIALYPRDTVILSREEPADALYVVLRGAVQERRGGEVAALHGPGDRFGLQALYAEVKRSAPAPSWNMSDVAAAGAVSRPS